MFRYMVVMVLVLSACVLGSEPAPPPNLPDFTAQVEKALTAVVHIRTTKRVLVGPYQPVDPRAPALQGDDEVSNNIGSGFILTPDGYVLTNAHVIADDDGLYVTLTDKREFKAKLIGSDTRADVALLKIDGVNFPVLQLGDVSQLKVGEWVVAIGSPFGYNTTVTAGIISAKSRDIGSDIPFLQTDAAINPGSSGGPLLNTRGEVIGINSIMYSPTQGYVGVSFALPIDAVMAIAEQLKTTGHVTRGYIGIKPVDVPRGLARKHRLAPGNGALVNEVIPGSPAELFGIQAGDVVTTVAGKTIAGVTDVIRTLSSLKPGTPVVVQVIRGSELVPIVLVVAELTE